MNRVRVKRILVPTDFSDCSQQAVDYAIALAQTFQAKVILFHVVESPVYGLDFTLVHPGAQASVRHRVIEMLQEGVERLRAQGIETEGHFVSGIPFLEIINAAKQHEVDLIVMGTHGRTGLAHVFLGSTAERVVQRAPCPVLTVRPEAKPLVAAEPEEVISQAAEARRETALCQLCGQPSKEIICETCKIKVQAEALDKKRQIEKEGRVEAGRR